MEKEENKQSSVEILYDSAEMIVTALVLMLLFMTFFFRQVNVEGRSMNDTLQDSDRLIVCNFLYTPQQGDIVTVSHGANLPKLLIKRVIAVEGQHIRLNYDTGEVSVDGVLLREAYVKGRTIPDRDNPIPDSDLVVPEGYVFVMGDNREHSTDSRSTLVGLVPVNNIIGQAVFRWYPFTGFGAL